MALRNIVSRAARQAPKLNVVRNVASRAAVAAPRYAVSSNLDKIWTRLIRSFLGTHSVMASRTPFIGKLALALGGVSLALAAQQVSGAALDFSPTANRC
jgi:hypothetical protein